MPDPCPDCAALVEAMSKICIDSNPDWTARRVAPVAALNDIHKIAVDAYFGHLVARHAKGDGRG